MADQSRLDEAKATCEQAMATASRTSRPPADGATVSRPGELDGDSYGPEYAAAERIVLRKLAAAPRSRAQLAEALDAKAIPGPVAGAVLDRMEEVGLVDDEAYAQMVVRSHHGGRGMARSALAMELRKRGVDAEIVDEALSGVDATAERDAARRLVDKRMRTLTGLDIDVKRRRLAGMLARKGYAPGIAYAVIAEAIAAAPEHLRD